MVCYKLNVKKRCNIVIRECHLYSYLNIQLNIQLLQSWKFHLYCAALFIVFLIFTHANESRVSIAIIRVCVILSVSLFVCPRDKTKTAENIITKLGIRILQHDTSLTN